MEVSRYEERGVIQYLGLVEVIRIRGASERGLRHMVLRVTHIGGSDPIKGASECGLHHMVFRVSHIAG